MKPSSGNPRRRVGRMAHAPEPSPNVRCYGGVRMLIERLRQSGYVLQSAPRSRPSVFRLVWRWVKEVWDFAVEGL